MHNDLTLRRQFIILIMIVTAGITIRLIYHQVVLGFGGEFDHGSDTGKYVKPALALLEFGRIGIVTAEHEVVPNFGRMPMYSWFLAGVFKIFGASNYLAVVTIQAFVDGMTILFVGMSAWAIKRRWALTAAILAALLPNLISHTAWVLTEVLFLMFFSAGIAATLWAIRGQWRVVLLIGAGIGFGLALMTRPVLIFFPVVLYPLLFICLWQTSNVPYRKALALSILPIIAMLACVTPRLLDTYMLYGKPVLTTQSGAHALKWVIPCLKVPWTCGSMPEDWQRNKPIVESRLALLGEDAQENPVVLDMIKRQLAAERLRKMPLSKITIGMVAGMTRNLIQSSFYHITSQLKQPNTFLSAMPGSGIQEKLLNFLDTNRTNPMMWLWGIAHLALGLSRLVQLAGIFGGLTGRSTWPVSLLLSGILTYFLVVSGPIGNAKYRMPMEPILILYTLWGVEIIQALRHKLRHRQTT